MKRKLRRQYYFILIISLNILIEIGIFFNVKFILICAISINSANESLFDFNNTVWIYISKISKAITYVQKYNELFHLFIYFIAFLLFYCTFKFTQIFKYKLNKWKIYFKYSLDVLHVKCVYAFLQNDEINNFYFFKHHLFTKVINCDINCHDRSF